MTVSELTTPEIVGDPKWLAHRYDPEHDAVHFVSVPRADIVRALFLTEENLPAGAERIVLRRDEAVAAAPPPAPVHFIFHSAFCCSTLLARALEAPGVATSLKEPLILNDITGWRHRGGGPPAKVAQVLDQAIGLLARPFALGEAVIVKPSNVVNGLANGIMAMRPTTHAVLLHAPLETYLRSIAKKAMTGRLWVRDLLVKQLRDGMVDLGLSGEDYIGLTDLQAAAVGWIAQQALFARLAESWPLRVRTLDSETLLARPYEAIAALSAHFGIVHDAAAIDAIVTGPAFTRHSKADTAFSSAARAKEYRDAAALHGDEIIKTLVWAKAVADNARVSCDLPNILLG